MRHRKNTKTLGRKSAQRKALFVNLSNELIKHESIKTTKAKAKKLRQFVEPLITKSEDDSLEVKRFLLGKLQDEEVVDKLLEDIGPRFEDRPGGYTRIIKLHPRDDDGADMARIELVE